MLVVSRQGDLHDDRVEHLPNHLEDGDLIVVNDAATLPASLSAKAPCGAAVEVRLAALQRNGTWQVVLFGHGDWRTPTERRGPPPQVTVGEEIVFTEERLRASVVAVSPQSARLVTVRFHANGAELWSAIYACGVPIQYAHVEAPLPLWSVQTAFAARPWAVELASAGRPLSYRTLRSLRRRGVGVARVTHAAGLSSTGDPRIDRCLPLPERFEVPARTVRAIADTKRAGGRVFAVGTSVVRALEASEASAAAPSRSARHGVATLRIGPEHRLRVVDGLLTGMHVEGESHYELTRAFLGESALRAASAHATAAGYLCHEFGDTTLIMPARVPRQRVRSDTAKRERRSHPQAPWT